MLCAIWYHLHNWKNVKNTNVGATLLVKLRVESCILIKVPLLHGCFSRFFWNCTNRAISRKASYMSFWRRSGDFPINSDHTLFINLAFSWSDFKVTIGNKSLISLRYLGCSLCVQIQQNIQQTYLSLSLTLNIYLHLLWRAWLETEVQRSTKYSRNSPKVSPSNFASNSMQIWTN